jgi:hypothetical protein
MSEIDQLLSDRIAIRKLPYSQCRNCGCDLRLYKRRWYHVSMVGGEYYRPDNCHNPQPLRCKKCGGRIDYRTTHVGYYDFKCQSCIAEWYKGDKIGDITAEVKRLLDKGTHQDFKYGTSCSVVVTKTGIFFEDIC